MKHLSLLCALLLITPALVLPSHHSACARPEDVRSPTQAQKNAIEQWAGVVRRCRSTKVMFEVADLLEEVTHKVESQKDKGGNYVFVLALEQMHKAATLKAQAYRKRDGELMEQAERMVKLSVATINGRVTY